MLTVCPADVLLDSPPGVSCPAMTVARDVDAVLLVADPTPFGFHDFRLAHQAYGPQGVPVAVTVNRAGLAADISPDWRRRFESLRDGLRAFVRAGGEPCAK